MYCTIFAQSFGLFEENERMKNSQQNKQRCPVLLSLLFRWRWRHESHKYIFLQISGGGGVGRPKFWPKGYRHELMKWWLSDDALLSGTVLWVQYRDRVGDLRDWIHYAVLNTFSLYCKIQLIVYLRYFTINLLYNTKFEYGTQLYHDTGSGLGLNSKWC